MSADAVAAELKLLLQLLPPEKPAPKARDRSGSYDDEDPDDDDEAAKVVEGATAVNPSEGANAGYQSGCDEVAAAEKEAEAEPAAKEVLDKSSWSPLRTKPPSKAPPSAPAAAPLNWTLRAVPGGAEAGVVRPKAPPVPRAAVPNSLSTAPAPRRKCAAEALATSTPHSPRSVHEPQMEQLLTQNSRLQEELQSLRDMYAKHTAYTELKCDRLLREKDHECAEWYKLRKLEIKDLRAGVTVMQALFVKKRRRVLQDMASERASFTMKEKDFEAQVKRLTEQCAQEAKKSKELLHSKSSSFDKDLQEAEAQKAELESKAARLEQQLEASRLENIGLKEQSRQKSQELEQVKSRLAEAQKNANIDNRDQQIQTLEAELQTTRRTLKERWKKEVESLRQELMDYVRFIVHILPENWDETEAADKVPPELKEQLSWMAGSKNVSPSKARGGPRGKKGGFLPSTDILARGAIGGQYANPGPVPMLSPRKRGVDGMDMSF